MSGNRTARFRTLPALALSVPAALVMTAAIGVAVLSPASTPAGRPAAISAATGTRTAIRLDAHSSQASATSAGSAVQAQATSTRRGPRAIARYLLHRLGFKRWQYTPLNRLWTRESSWRVRARNPYSGAYGIPQAVPGRKMASAGPHWRRNPWTQIRWGLRYIRARYRTPHRAWRHELRTGWY